MNRAAKQTTTAANDGARKPWESPAPEFDDRFAFALFFSFARGIRKSLKGGGSDIERETS